MLCDEIQPQNNKSIWPQKTHLCAPSVTMNVLIYLVTIKPITSRGGDVELIQQHGLREPLGTIRLIRRLKTRLTVNGPAYYGLTFAAAADMLCYTFDLQLAENDTILQNTQLYRTCGHRAQHYRTHNYTGHTIIQETYYWTWTTGPQITGHMIQDTQFYWIHDYKGHTVNTIVHKGHTIVKDPHL
jgi:hypothetical protein